MIKHLLGLASIGLIAIGAVGCGEQVQGEYVGKFKLVKNVNCSSSKIGDLFDASVILRINSKNVEVLINQMDAESAVGNDASALFKGQTFEADKDSQNRITTYDAIYQLSDAEQNRILSKVDSVSLTQEEMDRVTQAIVTVEGDLSTDRSVINTLRIDMERYIPASGVSGGQVYDGLADCQISIESVDGLLLNK